MALQVECSMWASASGQLTRPPHDMEVAADSGQRLQQPQEEYRPTTTPPVSSAPRLLAGGRCMMSGCGSPQPGPGPEQVGAQVHGQDLH